MKILVVTQNYYPDDFNINEITFQLVKDGHQVDVLTGLPNYATGDILPEYKWPKVKEESINGVKVYRTRVHGKRNGVFNRFLNYASFAIFSTLRLKYLPKDYDLIFGYQLSPISMVQAARSYSQKHDIPLLLYALDIWPESLKAWGMGESNPLYKVISKYSKSIYKSADKLLVSSKPFINYMKEVHDISLSESDYLPQHSLDMYKKSAKAMFTDNAKHFVYAGNIGAVQMVDSIVEAASILKQHSVEGIRIDIFGDGSEFSNIKNLVEDKELQDIVTLHGRVAKDELIDYYMSAYAFILTLKRENYIGDTLPAKLQGYMSAAKPIIAMAEGATKGVINESMSGLVVDQGDSAQLAKSIIKLYNDKDLCKNMGIRARDYYEDNFTLNSFMSSLYNHVDELLN